MGRLSGRVAIITGAAGGMGAEHARLFVAEGASVVLTDVMEEPGRMLADELGERAHFIAHDVADPDHWRAVVAGAEAEFGRVGILVNNAGAAGRMTRTASLTIDEFRFLQAVNQEGVFLGMQAVIPGMLEAGSGSIVNISSVSGLRYAPGTPNIAYSASKFAVRGMSKAAAVEYGSSGIRVNSVHPGAIRTPMSDSLGEKTRERILDSIPLRRMAEPREISQLVLFLASEESSYITGAEMVIDGGWTAR